MIGLVIAFLVLSLGVHEAAHGWVALKCGDTTARDLGRITLNPFVHIDLFMTVLVPIVVFYLFQFPFGGAKPVPVNFHSLRKPYRDMAFVAIAGPLSNVLLAMLFFAIRKLVVFDFGIWEVNTSVGDNVLQWTIFLNLLLAAFNMLPIPPLDGSRVMTWLLPAEMREAYTRLEGFGLLIVIVAIQVPVVRGFMRDTVDKLMEFVIFTVTLNGIW